MLKERPKDNLYALRGKLTDGELAMPFTVRATRRGEDNVSWAKDYRGDDFVVQQRIVEEAPRAPDSVVFVIDGSARMSQYLDTIADVMTGLPNGLEFSVLVASDEVFELVKFQGGSSGAYADASDKIRSIKCVGGCDNVPALIDAWEIAAKSQNSAIVWLHATQPIQMQGSEELIQKWERRGGNPKLYDFQFGGGANMVAKSLEDLRVIRRIPNFGNSKAALDRMADEWSGEAKRYVYKREHVPMSEKREGKEGTAHIVRLDRYAKILELSASHSDADKIEAIKIAQKYQLVTPVSGAVVLESKAQYDEAGLNPVDGSDSPSIVPEPETWALMIVGMVVLLVMGSRKARLCKG